MLGWPGITRIRLIVAFAYATLLIGTPLQASAQAAQSRDARDVAAAEFVAETYPATAELRARALAGQILPFCRMQYPQGDTTVGSSTVMLPWAERLNIMRSVDMAMVRQNLVAAGMDDKFAKSIAEGYRNDLESFDKKTDQERAALLQKKKDPLNNLLETANFIGLFSGLPKFRQPESCPSVYFSLSPPTPYRFVTNPSGASVFVIPRFSFRVCQLQFADPYSRSTCAGWIQVPDGSLARIAGIYEYSAEWPDGAVQRERTRFEYLGQNQRDIRIVRP